MGMAPKDLETRIVTHDTECVPGRFSLRLAQQTMIDASKLVISEWYEIFQA